MRPTVSGQNLGVAAVRGISARERRLLLVRRHHLAGDAAGPDEVTRSLVALHATDPASVYLSVLARSHRSMLTDVSDAMYERRDLVRWMAMRRTLFVFDRADIPLVQAAVSAPLAAALRRRLISRLHRNGTDPPIDGDAASWLAALGDRVEDALRERGTATGAQLSTDVPRLRTTILPVAASEQPQHVTSPLLTVLGTDARIVRGTPTGAWTSRGHRWEPIGRWWPDGLPALDRDESQRTLVRRYLERFGPATFEDVQWWTGWTKTATRRALDGVPTSEVDLHGEGGIALDGVDDPVAETDPVATLLPALDPTPMGWKSRGWFLGIDRQHLFDRAGNIGPTVWWDGEVVGSWAVAPTGEVRTAMLADRGATAEAAVTDAAEQMQQRLGGTVVTPAARTPLERSLVP